jgi:hypothetical protein
MEGKSSVTVGRNAAKSGSGSAIGADGRPRGKRGGGVLTRPRGKWGRQRGAQEAAVVILTWRTEVGDGPTGWHHVAGEVGEGRGGGGQHGGRMARCGWHQPRADGHGRGWLPGGAPTQ